jgi:hypothetical protein
MFQIINPTLRAFNQGFLILAEMGSSKWFCFDEFACFQNLVCF